LAVGHFIRRFDPQAATATTPQPAALPVSSSADISTATIS
jgi:hypothetical protein